MLERTGAARAGVPAVAFAAVAVVAAAGAGALLAQNRTLGVAAVVAIVLGAAVLGRPIVLAVVALVGVYVAQRFGGTSVAPGTAGGVAYSDVLLAAAAAVALPFVVARGVLRRLALPLGGLAVYLSSLLPTLFLNQTHRADLEWVHRLVLVGGSLVVGAWIVQEGAVRPALRWLVGVTAVVSVAAAVYAVRHGFEPATPFGLNKNFLGAQFGAVILVVLVAPRAAGVAGARRFVLAAVIAVGLLASQSRGGMIAAVAGLLVAFVLDLRAHSRGARLLAAVVAVVLAGFSFFSIRDQLNQSAADVNNSSIGVRRDVERVTRQIWRTSPIDGVGLKYFTTGEFGPAAVAPTNIVDNELAESGVIGLGGFVVLQAAGVIAAVRRRRGDPLVALGVGSVVGLLVHGQLDTYWIAGSASLPYLLLGMGLGQAPAGDDGSPAEADADGADEHEIEPARPGAVA